LTLIIDTFKNATKSLGDTYINFSFYKHLYLRCPFGDQFNKSVFRSAGLLQHAIMAVKEKESLKAADSNLAANKPSLKEVIAEEEAKAKQLSKDKGGFFKSLMDKVDTMNAGKLVSEMLAKPKHSSRSYKELEEYYIKHLEMFKRVGLVFGQNDDYEFQLEQREQQITTLQVRVHDISCYVMEYLRDKNINLNQLDFDEEDITSVVELIVFASLHMQETKEIKTLNDVLAKILLDQIKENMDLGLLIQDLEEKAKGDARIKRHYLDKARICEEKSTSLELKMVEKDEEAKRLLQENGELGRKLREVTQAEAKLKFTNIEFRSKVGHCLSRDSRTHRICDETKS
jgi:hypothetical protein